MSVYKPCGRRRNFMKQEEELYLDANFFSRSLNSIGDQQGLEIRNKGLF